MSTRVKVQHYVPRFLLRWHATEASSRKGEQVWCFDKHTDRAFLTNIRGVAAENRYYEVDVGEHTYSLEGALSDLEGEVAPALTRLIESRNLQRVRGSDRTGIAVFVAAQLSRTPAMREMIGTSQKTLAEALQRRGIDPELVPDAAPMSAEDVRALSLHMLSTAGEDVMPHLLDKHWFLVAGDGEDPFYVGDNPVVLDNSTFGPGHGNLGLISRGVEVYLPLSPNLCLGMTDRRIVEDLSAKWKQSRWLAEKTKKRAAKFVRRYGPQSLPHDFAETERANAAADEQVSAFLFGRATPYDAAVVTRLNALQMLYATRWVISSKNDFSLARRMIADDQNVRRSRASQMAWR